MDKIRYVNLSVKDKKLKKAYFNSLNKIFNHGIFILGPEVERLEKKLADFCNRKYAIATSSGTDALYLAIKSLDLKQNDEIITTPMSWVSSTNSISLNHVKPIFADVKDDLNIDVNKIEKLITKKTKAILFVNFTGKICDIKLLRKISKKYKLKLIEDAAQSFGSRKYGSPSGSFGDISCVSLNPMKVLHSLGEAGIVLTDSKKIYEKIKILRYAGTVNKENCYFPSLNFKIDTIQAAFVLNNLKNLNKKILIRNKNAKYYIKNLNNKIKLPIINKNEIHSFYSFTIIAPKRDKLKDYLFKNGIETKIQHPILISNQKAYKNRKNKDKLKNANILVKKILCLPINENLKYKELKYIVSKVNKFYS
jgi:dTDP-4-amino-4,6-dideoxygalactose transaminase